MASVKIDLGFGEQAVLSERVASGILTATHQRDAEEFLRRWPRTRSVHQERDYLRQLGLHVGYNAARRESQRYERFASVGREKQQGHGRDRARDDAIWRGRWFASADARERRDWVFPSVIR